MHEHIWSDWTDGGSVHLVGLNEEVIGVACVIDERHCLTCVRIERVVTNGNGCMLIPA